VRHRVLLAADSEFEAFGERAIEYPGSVPKAWAHSVGQIC
jgi:hypothetical protein